MGDQQVVAAGQGRYVGKLQLVWWRIDQLAVSDQSCRLREPGREPKRANLAPGLIARSGAAIKALEGGGLQEQRAHACCPLRSASRSRWTQPCSADPARQLALAGSSLARSQSSTGRATV